MANRYWVGGTGTWDNASTTNWSTSSGGASGASAPTTADAAIFDANSNTGTNAFTVTLSSGGPAPSCQTMVTTGIDGNMTVAGTGGSLTVASNTFTLTNRVTWSATGTITFSSATGTCNLTTAGTSLPSVTFSGGATYNFVDAFTTTGTLSLSSGTLTSTGSNRTITCFAFSASNGTVVNTGSSSTINITGNNTTVMNDTGTVTYTSPSDFNFTYSGATGTRTISTRQNTTTLNINVKAGTDTVTYNNTDIYGNLDFTGFSGTFSAANSLSIKGDLKTTATMSTSGSGTLTFNRGSSQTIFSNGISYTFNITIASGSNVNLSGANLTVPTLTLTQGTFNLSNNNLSATTFSSSNSNSRTLQFFNNETITITGSGTAWNCATATNLNINANGKISMTSASAKTFAGGGASYPTLENAGAGALTISGNNTFATLTNSVRPTTFTFTSGSTQTIGIFSISGTAGNLVTINSSTAASAATLSKAGGTVSSNYLSIRDSTATGGASWYAGANSTNVSGNTGWIFTNAPLPGFFFFFGV